MSPGLWMETGANAPSGNWGGGQWQRNAQPPGGWTGAPATGDARPPTHPGGATGKKAGK